MCSLTTRDSLVPSPAPATLVLENNSAVGLGSFLASSQVSTASFMDRLRSALVPCGPTCRRHQHMSWTFWEMLRWSPALALGLPYIHISLDFSMGGKDG